MKANKLSVSVGPKRDNFVLGSLITSSESLNASQSTITHGRGSFDTVKKIPLVGKGKKKQLRCNRVKKTCCGCKHNEIVLLVTIENHFSKLIRYDLCVICFNLSQGTSGKHISMLSRKHVKVELNLMQ